VKILPARALLSVRAITLTVVFAAALLAGTPQARSEQSPEAALAQLLEQARGALPAACAQPKPDSLTRILCSRRIRIGVRDSYPLFGTLQDGVRQGYEIDVARGVARRLGVEPEFVGVKAANRIPMLADDRIDLIIATMGHNTQRDHEVRFVRPHYYQSETALIGPKELPVADWKDITGRTVCVTIGNGSNADLVSRGSWLMLFDDAVALPDGLRDQTCTLAGQDDSFFAYYFTDLDFAGRFEQKLGFAQVPWGMAVARDGGERLGRALDLISQIFHRDGVFLDAARRHRVHTGFLEQQQAAWQRLDCNLDTGIANPACVLQPRDAALQPTPFVHQIDAIEGWIAARTGIDLTLPMLKTAPAWSLFLDGVVNSLVLVAGALAATLAFALAFGAALGSGLPLLRWPARALTVTLQSSPIVLTLVIAAAIVHGVFNYSSTLALCAAIVALGLANGCNAGQAISEAIATLRIERAGLAMGRGELFSRALSRSATQIVAFLINAAKGTPIASFIGAPELLSALTDITSFSTGRVTTYSLLLVFYTAVVIGVVWLCGRFRRLLERSYAAA